MPPIKPLVCPKCGVEVTKFRMFYKVPNIVNYEFDCPNCLINVKIVDKYSQKMKILDSFV